MNDEIEWNPDKMLEVTIKQPDDFLKVREKVKRYNSKHLEVKKIRSDLELEQS